jgi:hypothetical protein
MRQAAFTAVCPIAACHRCYCRRAPRISDVQLPRLTVSIEDDGVIHGGSSVIEVIWQGLHGIGDVGGFRSRIRGVDL